MKPITESELIELLPAGDATLRSACAEFDDALPSDLRPRGLWLRAVLEGHLRATESHVNGRPAFLFLWHLTFDGGCYIDMAKSLRDGGDAREIFAAAEKLAAENGAKYLLFATVRRGVAALATDAGFTITSVNLMKGVAHAAKG